jgi:uncharacterized protein YraI
VAGAAQARPGYMIDPSSIHTGPGFDYDRLARGPADAGVEVHTCTASYDWCQVSWRGVRGWMDGEEIEVRHSGRMVSLHDFGPRTGVPSFASRVEDTEDDFGPPRLAWDDQDFDRDGIPNSVDRDRDGDGIRNDDDRYPGDPRRD